MDVQEAETLVVDEIERILELPPNECEAELQQLFVLFSSEIDDPELLDDLEDIIDTKLEQRNNPEKHRRIKNALKRIQ